MFKIKNNIDRFKPLMKERWDIQGINAAPCFIHGGPVCGIAGMKRVLGYSYTKFIMPYENDFINMHYSREDLHKCTDEFFKRFRKARDKDIKSGIKKENKSINNSYNQFLWEVSEDNAEEMLDYIKHMLPKIKNLEMKEFLKEYHKFFITFCDAFNASHMIECIAMTTDVQLKDLLTKELEKKGMQEKFNEYFTLLTQPVEMPFIVEINNSLSIILGKIRENKEVLQLFKNNGKKEIKTEDAKEILKELEKYPGIYDLIREHAKEFYWIKTTWVGGEYFNKKDLVAELMNYIEKKEKIVFTSEEKLEKMKKDKNDLLEKLNLSQELLELIETIEFFAYWQDVRKVYVLKGVLALQQFVNELSERVDIKQELLKYLLTQELGLLEEMEKSELVKMLEERRKASVFIYIDNDMIILTGKEYKQFFDEMKKLKTKEEIKEINGMCASVGRVIGKVKVCLRPEELSKIEDGDILVTSMTRPEFIPAMKKAAAFITDEGGLTCHAAIVSREMNKPCIIGTKHATKVLKDGMLVEVNANHGLVKILE
jgi:phosphohistidine swiveling domain-containing protein